MFLLCLSDGNDKGANMNNRKMGYGWCQNKDVWEEQLFDPPNEYIIVKFEALY